MIRLLVAGTPAPQGSKTAFAIWAGVPCRLCRQKRFVTISMKESSKKVKPWRAAVKAAADAVMLSGSQETLTGPLRVSMTFTLLRPNDHFVNGDRGRGRLKLSAPEWPAGIPDYDKLLRSTGDALTDSKLWGDDAQVVDGRAIKTYPDSGAEDALKISGCVIRIEAIPPRYFVQEEQQILLT